MLFASGPSLMNRTGARAGTTPGRLTRLSALRVFFAALLALLFLAGSAVQAQKRKPRKESRTKTKRKTLPLHRLPARVTFGDGRVLEGKIKIRAPSRFTVRHVKKGVQYSKKVRLSDIREIEILKWKSWFLRRNKKGEIYRFAPGKFLMKLHNGKTLRPAGPLYTFVLRFPLENANGRVRLYTYWIDLLRGDGSWYTGMPPLRGRVRKTCYGKVVRKITFLKKEETEDD